VQVVPSPPEIRISTNAVSVSIYQQWLDPITDELMSDPVLKTLFFFASNSKILSSLKFFFEFLFYFFWHTIPRLFLLTMGAPTTELPLRTGSRRSSGKPPLPTPRPQLHSMKTSVAATILDGRD